MGYVTNRMSNCAEKQNAIQTLKQTVNSSNKKWKTAALVSSAALAILLCVSMVSCSCQPSSTQPNSNQPRLYPQELDTVFIADETLSFRINNNWYGGTDSAGTRFIRPYENYDGVRIIYGLLDDRTSSLYTSPLFFTSTLNDIRQELGTETDFTETDVPEALADYYAIALSYTLELLDSGACKVFMVFLVDAGGLSYIAIRVPLEVFDEWKDTLYAVLDSIAPGPAALSRDQIAALPTIPSFLGMTPAEAATAVNDFSSDWKIEYAVAGKVITDMAAYFDYAVSGQSLPSGTIILQDSEEISFRLTLSETDASRARLAAEEAAALVQRTRTFGAGTYLVGRDIDPGRYDILWQSGSGNLFVGTSEGGSDKVNQIFGSSSDIQVKEYKNVTLATGNYIEVKSTLVLTFQAKAPSTQVLTTPDITVLGAGIYRVGEDIAPGRYNVLWQEGFGNLFVGTYEGGGDKLIVSLGTPDNTFYTQRYNNLTLTRGDFIRINSTLFVRFEPA